MFSQSVTELVIQKNIYVRAAFSEKSGKRYILLSTTLVTVCGVSLLFCFLTS
jgi:hypothetical protein